MAVCEDCMDFAQPRKFLTNIVKFGRVVLKQRIKFILYGVLLCAVFPSGMCGVYWIPRFAHNPYRGKVGNGRNGFFL